MNGGRRSERAFGGARFGNRRWAVLRSCVRFLVAIAFLLPTCTTAFGSFEVLVTSGETSPDTNGKLLTLTAPALNNAGQVAFLSLLGNTENFEFDDVVLFRASSSALTIIAREGVTDLDGEPISMFVSNSPSIIANGTVSHFADRESAPGKQVPFLGNGGALDSYLEVGSASPTGMNQLVNHTVPVINASGTAAYRAFYTGSNTETGIYSRTAAGATTLHFKEGDFGVNDFVVFLQTVPTINETGQIGIAVSVDDSFSTRKAVMRLDGTTVHELARDGNLTTNGVTTVNNILSTAVPINASGQLAFEALYTQTGVTSRPGVFLVNNGSRTLLTPHTLPGAATAATNLRITSLNDAGTVSFTSDFVGGEDPGSGVFLADSSGTKLIALEDTATPDGKFFRRFFTESLALNQAGQLAFMAQLSDTANGSSVGNGLFRYDPTDGLEQILRVGSNFQGSVVTGLNFVGDYYSATQSASNRQAPDSDFSGFNSSGQLAFTYSLENGESGIALWSPGDDTPTLGGDYNNDGIVNAADYTIWRNRLGQSFTLDNEKPNAATPGLVDQEDYLFWKDNYGNTSGGGGGVAGDYNGDGVVNAADYCVWRNHLGESFTLANEKPDAATPGVVDQEDYLFWKTNYGNGSGSGSIAGGSVIPEPTAALMALFGLSMLAFARPARYSRHRRIS